MPSSLRYFCCACGTKDARSNYSVYPNAPKRKRKKSKWSGSSTFTSRKLLDNDINEHQSNGATFQQMVFHQQSKSSSRETSFEIHEYNNSAAKLLNEKAKSKRRKVQEIFLSDQLQNGMSRTTFPWMDENFTPNGCSNIRLGVSSVHLHAKRKLSNDSDNNKLEEVFSRNPDATSNVESASNSYERIHEVNSTNGNLKPRHKSYSTECDYASPNEKTEDSANLTRSVSFGDDKKSNKSNRSKKVSRISSGYRGDIRITKSDELKLLPPTDVSHLARPYRRSHASIQNVFNNINVPVTAAKSIPDTSFSSGVSSRTAISSTSDKSQKSKQPLTVVPKVSVMSNSKPSISTPGPVPVPMSPDPRLSESMYGYIPKIVQRVQASNALEGSKIDDFFMNCLNDRELNSFASAQEIQTPRSQNQPPREGIGRSSSVPSRQVDKSPAVSRTKSENIHGTANAFEIQQVTVEFGSQDSLDTDSVIADTSSRAKHLFITNNDFKSTLSQNSKIENFARYSGLDEEQAQIPFIDQEPDLIQGLQNIKVDNDTVQISANETSVHNVTQPEKELLWEHTFSSQNEYIESLPLKIPCRQTPPLSRRGERLSILNRTSNKHQATNNYWLSNLDSEVLY